jgi:uncharacterized protein (DUF1697 family)
MHYVAFLRGINVGGRNAVRMDDLRRTFESLGLASVSTYLQSGNVLFESEEADAETLAGRIEAKLAQLTGGEISVLLRSEGDLRRIVALEPFAGDDSGDSHRYVTFLRAQSDRELPRGTPKGDLEVLAVAGREVYSRPRLVGSRYGYPNTFVESKLRVPATTRNWAVVTAIVELFNAPSP